jgi:hypothetical protein
MQGVVRRSVSFLSAPKSEHRQNSAPKFVENPWKGDAISGAANVDSFSLVVFRSWRIQAT